MFDFLTTTTAAQDILTKEFNVTISNKKFIQDGQPYLLIQLPLEENQEFTINGKKMFALEQHFTIPKKPNKNTKSAYHYTLVLSDHKNKNKAKKYKTHLYFDNLDKVTMEPKLLTENEKFLNIDEAAFSQLNDYAIPSSALIGNIRSLQKTAIDTLIDKIEAVNVELTVLSENFAENKNIYLEKVKDQLESYQALEKIGCTLYNHEKSFYEKIIKVQAHVAPKTQEIEISPLSDENYSQTPPPQVTPKNEPKQEDNQFQSLITACEKHLCDFKIQEKPSEKLLTDMINKVSACRTMVFFEKLTIQQQNALIKTKMKLANTLCAFFNQADLIAFSDAYLLAVKLRVIPLKNQFIHAMLKNDSKETLDKLLKLNLVADSSKYDLNNDNSHFTLLEWCVQFDADNCFRLLHSNNFSLNYIENENSPFLRIVDNRSTWLKFLSQFNFSELALEKLSKRLLTLLEKRMLSATGEKLSLIQTKIAILDISFKIRAKLSKPEFSFIWSSFSSYGYVSATRWIQLSNHLKYQQTLLQYMELLYGIITTVPQKKLRDIFDTTEDYGKNYKLKISELNEKPIDALIANLEKDIGSYRKYIAFQTLSNVNDLNIKNHRNESPQSKQASATYQKNLLTQFNNLNLNAEKTPETQMSAQINLSNSSKKLL
ncbi:MAG: hypothetical protein JSS07_04095 [Proteobacteria bacterium]|nr:hypothetical protein [Pseudomonadota bacterium]